MGNWCTLTTLVACARPADARAVLGGLRSSATRIDWNDPGRWALRAGLLGSRVVQAKSVEKYGASLQLVEPTLHKLHDMQDVQVVQLCPGEGIALGPTTGPGLHLAWNYVASPAHHDLPAVAACLGGGATCIDAGPRRVLCLPEPAALALDDGRFADVVLRDDPLGRLVDALAAADAGTPGRTTRHLLGMYTPAYGWVHMVTLTLDLSGPGWRYDGEVTLEDGAGHNPVHYEFTAGPFARSIYLEDVAPIDLTGMRWPDPGR